MKTVLLLSQPNDIHATAVAEALARKDVPFCLWHTSDFPTRATESVRFRQGQRSVRLRGPELELAEDTVGTVWNRRPTLVIDEGRIHPADREFVVLGCETFRRSLLDTLAPEAFWVNPQRAVERTSKLRQHRFALEVGLNVPDTLYSNDPDEIRAFLREHGGRVVYKPFKMTAWKDDAKHYMTFTTLLREEQLVEDGLLSIVPGIYQALVPKAYELRVTMMGRRALTARVLSQQTRTGRLDWRKAYAELTMEPFELPVSVAEQCHALMRKLDIVFGCFDFIVRPEGEYVFLEVNQAGQFLFVENYAGLPLLDAFTEFLRQGSPDFEWRPDRVAVRYADVKAAALERLERNQVLHVSEPEATWNEGASNLALPRASNPTDMIGESQSQR
jgi:glutathione synthase/RimK-type ligase-like ATP-grasp enzyme